MGFRVSVRAGVRVSSQGSLLGTPDVMKHLAGGVRLRLGLRLGRHGLGLTSGRQGPRLGLRLGRHWLELGRTLQGSVLASTQASAHIRLVCALYSAWALFCFMCCSCQIRRLSYPRFVYSCISSCVSGCIHGCTYSIIYRSIHMFHHSCIHSSIYI